MERTQNKAMLENMGIELDAKLADMRMEIMATFKKGIETKHKATTHAAAKATNSRLDESIQKLLDIILYDEFLTENEKAKELNTFKKAYSRFYTKQFGQTSVNKLLVSRRDDYVEMDKKAEGFVDQDFCVKISKQEYQSQADELYVKWVKELTEDVMLDTSKTAKIHQTRLRKRVLAHYKVELAMEEEYLANGGLIDRDDD